ncbi:MAG: type II toxin-antitoxin system VapC family toxin [Deltaproteobacteria bacterium]|nr:type II toxin-antitoxin system VapC family toxin [Deltaproteobacteria bacterium]
MKRLLIDTNIYSHALRGTPDVLETLRKATEIAISAISIGELLSGFKKGARELQNREELDEFLDSPRVRIHYIDENTADFYAEIVSSLRKNGTPIPTNDIWIAATALQHGLKLFSKDHHFRNVTGIIHIS